MTARQPSVPNLITSVFDSWVSVVGNGSVPGISVFVVRRSLKPIRVLDQHPPLPTTVVLYRPADDLRRTPYEARNLDQSFQLLLIQILHHFAHVLRAFTRRDQQRIFGFHYDDVVHANHGHEFPRRVHVIPVRVRSEDALSRNQVAVSRGILGRTVFV